MPTTFRTDVVTGVYNNLVAFQAAHPTSVYNVFKVQPGDFAGTPLVYIGDRDERVEHTAGVRMRRMTPTVVLVGSYADRDTNAVNTDATVDLLVDYFDTVARTTVARWVLSLERIDDRELRVGDAIYPITVFTFEPLDGFPEGRD